MRMPIKDLMSPRTIDAADPIVQRLRRLEHESPELSEAARVYAVILPLLHYADLDAGPLYMTTTEIRRKMERGRPLLHGVDLDLDLEAMQRLMIRLAQGMETVKANRLSLWERVSARSNNEPGRIRKALEQKQLDVGLLLPFVAAGDRTSFEAAAQTMHLAPELLWTLAQNALKPALRAWCRQLSPLAAGLAWNKGNCFVCGATALFAELQDNDQVKHLRCGACGADWQFRRLQCVACCNEDHGSQHYHYAEKERDRMRIEVCEKCRSYIKVLSAFTPTPPELLAVEDLASIHLDYIAQEQGYTRVAIQ